jgi:hypothetical protein
MWRYSGTKIIILPETAQILSCSTSFIICENLRHLRTFEITPCPWGTKRNRYCLFVCLFRITYSKGERTDVTVLRL